MNERKGDDVCDLHPVSWLSLKTKLVGFPGLSLKTDSYGLVIYATKLI
jgi:hypothetical protein